jgi:trehalose-6-phosphate synthase
VSAEPNGFQSSPDDKTVEDIDTHTKYPMKLMIQIDRTEVLKGLPSKGMCSS